LRRFFTQAIRNYRTTGAVAPSSRRLARAMAAGIPAEGRRRILEVGAGTGAFTREILGRLRGGDDLHIVELNGTFCEALEERHLGKFRLDNGDIDITLHNAAIEEADVDGPFDAIICGLPFNNFPPEMVEELFAVMLDLLRTGGEMAYFEYLGMRWLQAMFGSRSRRDTVQRRRSDIMNRLHAHEGRHDTVLINIPPARVVRLRGQ